MADFEELLREANRDPAGNVALAHLRRRREDRWDFLVVARDNQPLLFWSSETVKSASAVHDERGNVLMVLTSTPPGAQPAGLLAMTADETGSPTGQLVAVVSSVGETMLEHPSDLPAAESPAEWGPDMLDSLVRKNAKRSGDAYSTLQLASADGGVTTVLVDWDGRPILFWLGDTGQPRSRELYYLAALEGVGLVGCAADNQLRPIRSNDSLLPPEQNLPT